MSNAESAAQRRTVARNSKHMLTYTHVHDIITSRYVCISFTILPTGEIGTLLQQSVIVRKRNDLF